MSVKWKTREEWKSALLTLPDHAYFDLMRRVFGVIKTPFNKNRLMEDLAAFLSRRETQEIIAAYINETDHRIIAAVAALREPASGDLESFFAGEYSYAELHEALLNLEERLIVYRFQVDGTYYLALNPLLEPALAPFAADTSPLFPAFSETPSGAPDGVSAGDAELDGRYFAAILAFAADERDFFKGEGDIRKKVAENGSRIFPSLDLPSLIGGLVRLGLLVPDGAGLRPDGERLAFFAGISSRERLEYWSAGIFLHTRENAFHAGYAGRSRVRALARFIHRFMDTLEPGFLYPRTTLRRIAGLLERGEPGIFADFSTGLSAGISAVGVNDSPVFGEFLASLEKTGLLSLSSPDLWGPGPWTVRAASGAEKEAPKVPSAVIAMDTAFSCILYPEIPFADALSLAAFCSVRETGTAVRFELTRDSAVRGFDQGLSASTMLATLDRLSGQRADQNLLWTLEDWETRYSAVSLHQGTVLALAEGWRYLAETEPLASQIARTLAPGLYLLSVREKTEGFEALRKAGVDIVAQPPPELKRTEGGPSPYPPLRGPDRLMSGEVSSPPEERETAEPDRTAEKAEVYKARFRLVLEGMTLPKAEKEELAGRIERRLIVGEAQINRGSVRAEKMEARNLDYMGKILVAKQAVAAKSLVEVLWSDPPDGERRALGSPEALEKRGGETVLVLRPLREENSPRGTAEETPRFGEAVRIPIGKISLLRRIKKSLFLE
jgi:hypothetical protein